MALWLVNPPATKRRKKGRTVATRKKAKRRPSAKQLAARRKFTAMAKARARAARTTSRVKRKRPTMARRKVAKKRRRSAPMRSVVRKGGGLVRRSSWRASGYRRNPRRRRRNPGMGGGLVGAAIGTVKDTGFALAGAAAGRFISNAIPFGQGDPIMSFGKSLLLAIAARKFGGRVLGLDGARMVAVGMLLGPTKDAALSVAPQLAPFLGSRGDVMYFDDPRLAAYAEQQRLAAYADGGEGAIEGVGAYSDPY